MNDYNSKTEQERFDKWRTRIDKKMRILLHNKNDVDLERYVVSLLTDRRNSLDDPRIRHLTSLIAQEYPAFKGKWKSLQGFKV